MSGPRGTIADPEFRKARARYAAEVLHAKGGTSTRAATAAFLGKFPTLEARKAYMHELAARAVAARLAKRAK